MTQINESAYEYEVIERRVGESIVIDCDSHVLEPPDLWQRYLEPKYRDRAIRIETNNGVEQLIIGENVVLEGMLAGLGGAHVPRHQLFMGGMSYLDGCPPGSFVPEARAKLLDAWGIDRGVLFPTIGILPFPTPDNDLINAYCRAYNSWQADFAATIPDRVVAIATINWADVDAAVIELERCIKLGFKGLFVPPETIAGKGPGNVAFDPIWALCEEAGIPGCLHVIVRFDGAAVPFRAWHDAGSGPVFSFGLGATGQLIPALASMVLDGVLERFERLKIVSVEAGAGYAAYLMDRLDEKFQFFGMATGLQLKPSEYIQRNCYFVAEPEERTIDAMLDLVGEDKILWGSDFPHIDSTLAAPTQIRDTLTSLTDNRRRKVLGENAVELFGL